MSFPRLSRDEALKTKVLSLKNPSAALLMLEGNSKKTVENRSIQLPPGRYLICASKAKPRRKDLEDARRRIALLGEDPSIVDRLHYGSQEILGWVEISGSYLGERGNVWESPGAAHMMISDSWEFKESIKGVPGCQATVRYVKSYPSPIREMVLAKLME